MSSKEITATAPAVARPAPAPPTEGSAASRMPARANGGTAGRASGYTGMVSDAGSWRPTTTRPARPRPAPTHRAPFAPATSGRAGSATGSRTTTAAKPPDHESAPERDDRQPELRTVAPDRAPRRPDGRDRRARPAWPPRPGAAGPTTRPAPEAAAVHRRCQGHRPLQGAFEHRHGQTPHPRPHRRRPAPQPAGVAHLARST